MKIYFIFCLVIIAFAVKGQSIPLKPFLYEFKQTNNSILIQPVIYKNYFANNSYYDLQIFNSNLGLFENYNYVSENQYERLDKMTLVYSKSPFLSSNISSLINPLFVNAKDSFNPSGATNFESVLGVGLINLLLNKNSFYIQH